MLEKIKERVKNWMQKAGAETGLAKEFKDVFEIGGVPAFNQFYYFGIFIWKYLYKGYYKPWHRIAAPTLENPYATRDMERMDIAKAISAEMAGLIWSEQCEVHVSQGDSEEQPLDEFVHEVLAKNNFWQKMQEFVERVMALGGGAMKVWYEVRRDSEGNEIPDSGNINIGFCMADQFIPTAWDNAKVSDGVFISRQAKDGYYYTRLEWHKWDGLTYWISNELYRSEQKKEGAVEPQDILGFRYPLNEIYPFLNEDTSLQGISTSLFAYCRTAIANNIDDNSPLGVSIYGNALSTLKALDICYDSFIREFVLGKKRIIVPAQCIRTVADPQTGEMRRYFDASDEVYEALATDTDSALQIKDNSVELRVDAHEQAIDGSAVSFEVRFNGAPTLSTITSGDDLEVESVAGAAKGDTVLTTTPETPVAGCKFVYDYDSTAPTAEVGSVLTGWNVFTSGAQYTIPNGQNVTVAMINVATSVVVATGTAVVVANAGS